VRSNSFALGAPRRRRTPDEIRTILGGYRQSGLSLLAFAHQQELCYGTLRRWRADAEAANAVAGVAAVPASPRRPRDAASTPRFVPVELESGVSHGEFILAWAPGRSLRIPAGFEPGQLRRLLEVLGVLP
jgi:hypothetical protein